MNRLYFLEGFLTGFTLVQAVIAFFIGRSLRRMHKGRERRRNGIIVGWLLIIFAAIGLTMNVLITHAMFSFFANVLTFVLALWVLAHWAHDPEKS